MIPIRLLEPALTHIASSTQGEKFLEGWTLTVSAFAVWLAGVSFILVLGKTVGSYEKAMAIYLLEIATPDELPVRIP